MSSPFSYSEKIIQTLSLSLSLPFFLFRKNYSDSFPLSFPSLFLVQKKLFRLFPSLFPFPFSCFWCNSPIRRTSSNTCPNPLRDLAPQQSPRLFDSSTPRPSAALASAVEKTRQATRSQGRGKGDRAKECDRMGRRARIA